MSLEQSLRELLLAWAVKNDVTLRHVEIAVDVGVRIGKPKRIRVQKIRLVDRPLGDWDWKQIFSLPLTDQEKKLLESVRNDEQHLIPNDQKLSKNVESCAARFNNKFLHHTIPYRFTRLSYTSQVWALKAGEPTAR